MIKNLNLGRSAVRAWYDEEIFGYEGLIDFTVKLYILVWNVVGNSYFLLLQIYLEGVAVHNVLTDAIHKCTSLIVLISAELVGYKRGRDSHVIISHSKGTLCIALDKGLLVKLNLRVG